ncbi:Protein of unknown function [Hydrocarboniphaga daqingensis]|jgi:hypothetical protein|uniref:DUF3293 domain-containing protein n=1 Tax=Hydrocarboniphaga daqingensis TaxID=490188 RepID=A0A1M5Q0Q0_9GAMM|nr:DUF3293 domain-containing protein [Hydrocarboniphaga daqingensis]SHH07482.1 Protein of unknown function [Hydrocarboniphaga daqingensis]
MNDTVRDRWESVYRKAEYKLMLDDTTLTLRIGQYDADAEQLIQRATGLKREWYIITPCNPRSEQARSELNLYYFNELRYEVESRSGIWFQALNCDPSGEWPDEPGFMLVDADRVWVMDMGERFYQNALVTARVGEAPRLLWLNG